MAGPTLPLNQRTIPVTNKQNGMLREAPAIHKMWSSTGRVWSAYQPPPPGQELRGVQGARDSWLTSARKVEVDLSWLLRLPCHKFWSQVCHDDDLHQWLENLLEIFPRHHDSHMVEDEGVVRANNSVLRKLFLVFVRLCTFKESSTDYFSPEYYGHMIYDQYLLEMPKILDICVLFHPCNPAITHKMVANVFKAQPQYIEDLVTAGLTMVSAMDSLGEQLQALQISPLSPESVPGHLDLVDYSVDISHTMSALLEVYPPAAGPLHQGCQLEVKVAAFYSNLVVPLLGQSLRLADVGLLSEDHLARVKNQLSLARHQLIKVFRAIVNQVSLTPLLQGEEVVDRTIPVEEFLTIFTSVLSEKSFLLDYNTRFSVREDTDMLEQLGLEVDSTRKHYILDVFAPSQSQSFGNLGARPKTTNNVEKSKPQSGDGSRKPISELESRSSASPPSQQRSGVELESLVSTVRDLLPYLGEGFVETCLHSYQYKVDELINALLEGNLPPHLSELDQSKAREPSRKSPEPEPVPRSVYENDEFDINTQDMIDTTKIHRGKRNKGGDAKRLLDDKSHIDFKLRDKFSKLGIVADDMTGEDVDNGYDDEYDDTYDDNAIGQKEPDAGDDSGRQFVLPVALGGGKIRPEGRGIIDAEESDDDEAGMKPNLNFVRNPEEVRAERERKHQEKMGQRVKKGAPNGPSGPPTRDVVGRAKGQGQDKNVLINRARKNANKGKGQRVGADKKAAKGMF